ncbi:MAG: hemerythrin domain-containing protein [Deltaproteobacteria bacterium]|nr:hemerythrin domain-containing protein [Deltaproteobacteria bacterium]
MTDDSSRAHAHAHTQTHVDAHTSSITSFFVADHRACDKAWTDLEAAASPKAAEKTRALWASLVAAVEGNFHREEDVLFPAFEQASGMVGSGPTEVMRHEHKQMRAMLTQMKQALEAGDIEGLLDHGDTFLMLMKQHNMKEEGVLFPMAERALEAAWPQLRQRLNAQRSNA